MRRLRRFITTEDGGMMFFWVICSGCVMGFAALSYDLGRMAVTQTELQSYADQVALAAAGELDGGGNAIIRANSAVNTLITDTQTFGVGATTLTAADVTVTYHQTLPAADTTAMGAGTANPALAEYARVVVAPQTVTFPVASAANVMINAIGGGVNMPPQSIVQAEAVAGFTQFACDVTPMFFCLPSPSYSANANIGNTILLRSRGQGAGWGPGDFGFLDPTDILTDPNGPCAGLSGPQKLKCVFAAEGSVTQCFAQRGVDLEPGQKIGLTNVGYNVRFDWYAGSMKNDKNKAGFAPAPNVIKGIIKGGGGGNACINNNTQASPDTVGLPPDDCFPGCGRYGDGVWSSGRANYETVNYAGSPPVGTGTATTRYQYYLAEIAAAGGATSTTSILPSGLSETGRPQCSSNQSSNVDRRTFVAAGIDCAANNIQGAATNIPVVEFFRMFMISPSTQSTSSPPSVDIYAEIIGSANSGGGGAGVPAGVFHDLVQLYR